MTIFASSRVLDAYGVSDTTRCGCGGFKCVVHCVACGSTQVYIRKRAATLQTLPDSPKPFKIRAFTCKLCGAEFSEIQSTTQCTAKTRWRQKMEQEKRVEQAIARAPTGLQQTILDAGKKHIAKVQREVGPLEAAQIERGSRVKTEDPTTAKLFDPPRLEGSEE